MAGISLKQKEVLEEDDEVKRVEHWRRFLFRDEMTKAGMTEVMADDIEALVHSSASWQDIKALREDGCPPDLILKILS